jgi:regulator of RNase E activity RraA
VVTARERPATDRAVLDLYKGLASSTVGNVLDDLGLGGIMLNLRPIVHGMHFVGAAMTVREVTGTHGTFRPEEFGLGSVVDAARPGDVVVIDNGGQQVSTWGGVASLAAQKNGAVGLIVDGGVRDADEIAELGFPVFSRHVVPMSGKTRVKVIDINCAVKIDNVSVSAGDILVGDSTGIVRVPLKRAVEVAEKAQMLERQDRQAAEEIKAGLNFTEALRKFAKL